MKRQVLTWFVLGIALLLHVPAGAEIVVSRGVLANGGGEMSYAGYSILGTLGQPAVGEDGGFWAPPGIGDIDLEPDSWTVVVFQGDTTETYLSVINTGTGVLNFAVSAEEAEPLSSPPASGEKWLGGEAETQWHEWTVLGDEDFARANSSVPWLGISPSDGSVPPGDTLVVTLSVDGTMLTPYRYFATVRVESNDPDEGLIEQELMALVPQYRYDHHDAGNVVFCLTAGGCYGYWDRVVYWRFGDGFQYPATDPEDYLAYGSFWAGTGPDRMMDGACDYDWETVEELVIEEGMPERGTARFNDSQAPVPLGLSVFQESIAWSDAPDDDYVKLFFTVTNASLEDIENLYLGLHMDWDVNDEWQDVGGFDSDLAVGYQFDSEGLDTTYAGIVQLTAPTVPTSFRFIHNPTYSWPNGGHIDDAVKYDFMSSGVTDVAPDSASDWSMVMSIGPMTLAAGDSERVEYALVAGTGHGDLRLNALRTHGWSAVEEGNEFTPSRFALHQNYPNPFNPVTTLEFSVPTRSRVTMRIYDVGGREVMTLVDGELDPGYHKAVLDAEGLASGVYFCRMMAGRFVETRKLVLLK